MLSNSAFRDLLNSDKTDDAARPREDSKAVKAAKQAKAKAAHERRIEMQKKKEEALAAQARYRDRAEERRKELSKSGVGIGPEAPPIIEDEAPEVAVVPAGPTFAQVGNREDLSQQKHRLTIAQSKYLGGDIEHTHLVKGLDYALLQKRRAELTATQKAEEEKRLEREAQRAARTDARTASGAVVMRGRPSGAPPVLGKGSVASQMQPVMPDKSLLKAAQSDMARGVLRTVAAAPIRPNRALTSGRLLFIFDVSNDPNTDKPMSLVRAEDDLSIVRPRGNLVEAALQAPIMNRLTKAMAYLNRRGADRARKAKKEALSASLLVMRPLKLKQESAAPAAAKQSSAHATAGGATNKEASAAADHSAHSGGGAIAGKPPPPPPPPRVAGGRASGDVDDIFGDGSGSDYVCRPSEAQQKAAARERIVKATLGKKEGYFDKDELDEGEVDEGEEEEEGAVAEEGGDASALLASVLGAQRESEGADTRARSKPAKDKPAADEGKQKHLGMGTVSNDSYAECFPDSFEGYNLELHGPDSDDEAGAVRSTRKGEEEAEEPTGLGKKGGKRVDREAQKKDAKMSRDLVEIERLIEERKKKRQRGDDGGSAGGFEEHPNQNEMF